MGMGVLGRNRIKDAERATARVLEMEPTAAAARQTGKLDAEYRFRLELTPAGGIPYEVQHEEKVPHAKMPIRGDVLAVELSRTDRERLRIDWDAAPDLASRARASAAAAQRGDAAGAAKALGFTVREDPPR